MNITSAEFIKSAPKQEQFVESDKLEIILVGKSNVGKSSFINALTNRKKLAKVGSAPGKTRMANFYFINNAFYIVDMPGYGYAKVGKEQRANFSKLIEGYLKNRGNDFVVLFLLDNRHEPSKLDLSVFNNILSLGITPLVILTKSDKISKNERTKMKQLIAKKLELPPDELYLFSNQDMEVSTEALNMLSDIIQ